MKNKVTTYILYAIGEITLVVIGILIAVQIDDWNENRKQSEVEKNYFRNLRNDLMADVVGIEGLIDLSEKKILAAKRIKARIDGDTIGSLFEFSNDMQRLIFVGSFTPNQNTYEEMLSSGNFSLISNDSIKLKLMALNQSYILIKGAQDHVTNDYHVFLEAFQRNLDWGNYYDLNKSPLPSAYDGVEPYPILDSAYLTSHKNELEAEALDLFKDKVFNNNIFLIEVNYAYFVAILQGLKLSVNEIILLIDQELAK